MTYYIDDLKPGMSESFTRTVTERDIQLFGEVSGDTNPVHFDEEFARTTMFKGRIAHGMLSRELYLHRARHADPRSRHDLHVADHALQGAGAHRRHGGHDLHGARSERGEAPRDLRLRLQGRRHDRRRRRGDGHGAVAPEGLNAHLPPLRECARRVSGRGGGGRQFRRRASRPSGADRGSGAQCARTRRAAGRTRLRAASAGILPPVAAIVPADAVPRQGAAACRTACRCDVRAAVRCADGVEDRAGVRARCAGEGAGRRMRRGRRGFPVRQGPRRQRDAALLYGRDGRFRRRDLQARRRRGR